MAFAATGAAWLGLEIQGFTDNKKGRWLAPPALTLISRPIMLA
jgi:hypothetical protein